MENLESKVMQAASGEKRFNPDEQRKYFGTFAERVVLSILLEDGRSEEVKTNFDVVLKELKERYDHLSVKVSAKLPMSSQMFYMKATQAQLLPATVVNEVSADSPFALLIHTDKAEFIDNTDIKFIFSDLFEEKEVKTEPKEKKKKSFWSKLF